MKTRLLICSLCVLCGLVTIPSIDAHNVAYVPTTIARIEDETFDRYHMQTGENLTIQGRITNNVEKDIIGWTSVFWDSGMNHSWEILAREPSEIVFDVPANSSVDYSITVKALKPGTYHMHTQFNIDKIGPHLGSGQTVIVEGEPLPEDTPFSNTVYLLPPVIAGIVIVAMLLYFMRKRK